jgi:cytochrome oxidase Cu insertion factor (SCO1/SenC/PrrC family)
MMRRLHAHGVQTVAILGFLLMSCAAARAGALIPVHGYLLTPLRRGRVLMRVQRVVGMLPAGMYEVAASENVPPPGTQVDALLTKTPHGLALQGAAIPAQAFVPGTPNAAIKRTIGDGDRLPSYPLVDEMGRPFQLDQFPGKVTLLAFVFTRCTDVCLTISSKFQQLQHLLSPRDFHLIEVSIDPMYDSPAVLAAYGKKFGANPQMWSLATGESSVVSDVMNSFGVSSLALSDDDFLHNAELVMIGRHGIVREVVQSPGWDPSNVAATARALAGLSSNPLRRLYFETFAQVAAFCGGNQSAATVVMLCFAIPLIAAVTIPVLVIFGRRIFSDSETKQRPAS